MSLKKLSTSLTEKIGNFEGFIQKNYLIHITFSSHTKYVKREIIVIA